MQNQSLAQRGTQIKTSVFFEEMGGLQQQANRLKLSPLRFMDLTPRQAGPVLNNTGLTAQNRIFLLTTMDIHSSFSINGTQLPRSRTYSRRVAGLILCLVLLVLGVCLSIAVGARSIPLTDVISALREVPSHRATALNFEQRVLFELRVPRTLIAIVVGASLGVAGALIQGHTRNPLADPGILGVNAGAALAVVSTFAVFGSISMFATTVAAFLGAVSATIIVFGLGRINGGNASPLTLTLSGAALSAVLNSITTGLILAEEANLDRMRFWTVGSVAGRGLDVFWGVLPFAVLGIVLAFASAPALNLLNLGDDVAQSLGVRTDRARLFGMVLISLLAGAATAMAGPVGFIGLIVPHLVRAITGPDYRWILPYSALLGATLMVLADVIGRIIARPGELPAGIVVAFIGAPLFFVLVFHRKGLAL